MGKIVVFESLSLDGVMQAPARPDEDRRGGFTHGGWATRYVDPNQGRATMESMTTIGAILLGRRTYEDLYAAWHGRTDGNPFTPALDNAPKYVASRTLKEPLVWMNSTLLRGDVAEAVAKLKAQADKDIVVMGSGELVQTLMQHNLVDEYMLQIAPLILGSGQRLFRDGAPFAALQLVDAKPTTTGVIVATYRPAESKEV